MRARTAIISASIATAGAMAYWLYRRSKSDDEALDEVAVSAQRMGEPIEEVTVTAKRIGLVAEVLNTVGSTATKIAASVASWFHPRGEKYKPLFDAATAKYGLPSGLLARVAYQESRFREDIINGTTRSAAGAVGIMQIVPKWHPELGEAGALDPARAIPYAAKYLASLKKQFGAWDLALAAYNWGPGNVQKHVNNRAVWPTETKNYVSQIGADVRLA